MARMPQKINWRKGHPSALLVDCPDCNHPARTTNVTTSVRVREIQIEAICRSCDRYIYLTMALAGRQCRTQ